MGTPNTYIWENNIGAVVSNNISYKIKNKANFSFEYDTLMYKPDYNLSYKIYNNEKHDLVDSELDEIRLFCQNFSSSGGFDVYAIDPDTGLYEGVMLAYEAEQRNLKYIVDNIPPSNACKWVVDHWEPIVAVIWDTGQLIMNPNQICQKCVLQFTEEEFAQFPKQPQPYYLWDFQKEMWVDTRKVDENKKNSSLAIRNAFEGMRWRVNGKYVPQFEQATWEAQYREATNYIKDGTYATPYIDTFLSAREDADIPSKMDLCFDIIKNYENFLKDTARANAKQWLYLKHMDNAESNEEIDNITQEAMNFINKFLWNE